MRVLLACEESQAVTREFRALGHEAYSCDILPTSGDNPEWHIQDDVLAYPKSGQIDPNRFEKAMEAKAFFMAIYNAPVQYVAVENPMPMKVIGLPEKTQVIQPYEYGDPYSKRTYLWLKNLPKLVPTQVLTEYQPFINGGGLRLGKENYKNRKFANNALERSKTFPGIAKAMATQWG